MTRLATAFVAATLALVAPVMIAMTMLLMSSAAQAQTKEIEGLLRHERTLDGMCRGGMDDTAQLNAVCCGRTLASARLNQLGWC